MTEKVPEFLTKIFKDIGLIEERIKELEQLETSVYKTEQLNFWHKQKEYLENK